jgi:protocatechuate 4,5-dioxygenase beta chain/2,3-dihydroxyphenylpropionate 1,2-dioxygenase
MAQIVLGVGTSHSPGQTGQVDRPPLKQVENVWGAWKKIKLAVDSLQPDLILEFSNDHWCNFYDPYPPLAIGLGATHFGPVDGDMIKIAKGQIPGQPEFARSLLLASYEAGFDPAPLESAVIDHGHAIPYHTFNPMHNIPLVPIFVNAIKEPMPTTRRLYQFGKFVKAFIASRPKNERIMIIGAGGIAHDVGTPRSGWIDEAFDHEFLENLEHSRVENVCSYTSERLIKSGNGAHEVRSWIAAMGAMEGARPKVMAYEPVVEWITGTGIVAWEP